MSTFSVYRDGAWEKVQQSVLAFLSSNRDLFDGPWPRAGGMRGGGVSQQEPAHEVLRQERLWPTPAASLPNDGEEPAQWLARFIRHAAKGKGATRAGVPLAVAARAPIVLRVAKVGQVEEARRLLRQHERKAVPELASKDELNPRWVELLMGFPEDWTTIP